uniref:dCTP deaminase n=1 Tax=Candidatus Kentrum sp. LFY TaxID=2126342 RepID=A0A450UT11_9GAMM|nr:MAG: dCTP deaminase [Candidatus Kentron sp. LFY]
MGLLTDSDLEKIIVTQVGDLKDESLLITPYEEESLTPVGYDLRVGSPYATSEEAEIKELESGQLLEIPTGSTALITTLENIRMPRNRMISGLIESKVTKVSKGLSHISTTVDPDWKGNLLIAVHNHSKESIELKYGKSFCTIVFIRNESPSRKECEKDPGRMKLFLSSFTEVAKKEKERKASLRNYFKKYVPLPVILFLAFLGYQLDIFLNGQTTAFFPAIIGLIAVIFSLYVSGKK